MDDVLVVAAYFVAAAFLFFCSPATQCHSRYSRERERRSMHG